MSAIDWVILITNNYQASQKFYKQVLGFKINRELPDEEFCEFTLDNCRFALFGRQQIEKVIDRKYLSLPGGAIYSLPEVDDVDKTYANLKKKGVTFIKEPMTQAWGQRTAYFTDPDGHIWEIQNWEKRINK